MKVHEGRELPAREPWSPEAVLSAGLRVARRGRVITQTPQELDWAPASSAPGTGAQRRGDNALSPLVASPGQPQRGQIGGVDSVALWGRAGRHLRDAPSRPAQTCIARRARACHVEGMADPPERKE